MNRKRRDRPKKQPWHWQSMSKEAALVTPDAPEEYDPTRHNYYPKVQALIGRGEFTPGQMNHLEILHDDWCAALHHGIYCDCDPIVRMRR